MHHLYASKPVIVYSLCYERACLHINKRRSYRTCRRGTMRQLGCGLGISVMKFGEAFLWTATVTERRGCVVELFITII